jgi:hypothetical protein
MAKAKRVRSTPRKTASKKRATKKSTSPAVRLPGAPPIWPAIGLSYSEVLDHFANNLLLRANFAAIAQNEQYITYMVRAPIEACPKHDALGPLAWNEEFNTDFAKLMEYHIKRG